MSPMQLDKTPEFEWRPEYEALLEGIASTDVVNTDWAELREIIKNKINTNISLFFATTFPPEPPAHHPPLTLPSGGLKMPPFPPRKLIQMHVNELPVSYMTSEQANEMKGHIFTQLDEFDDKPPFTIQRLCELCVKPKAHYNSVGKYLRAVEKSILVTSTLDSFPPLSEGEMDLVGRSAITIGMATQSVPSTPVFSPIPFLHNDSRRSKSRSPPPTPLTLGPALSEENTDELKDLGLVVDELDDPSQGHMGDHPIALTSVKTSASAGSTTHPFLGSLEQRFVKSEDKIDSESDPMVLDDDKENSKA